MILSMAENMVRKSLLAPTILAVACLLQSCGGESPTGSTGADLAVIVFEYPEVGAELRDYLLPGEVLQLTAQPIDSAGDPVTGVSLTWSSSNEAILSVSQHGELTGVAVGEATVTVSANGKEASLPFVVLAPVASLEVLPSQIALVPGGAAEIQFVMKDNAGNVLTARPLALTSSNPAVAAATQHFGVLELRAGSIGTTVIGIEREGKSAQLQVQVTTVQFDTVDAAGGRGCGLTADGTAWCWGTNAKGALGYGISSLSSLEGSGWTPIQVAGGHAFSQISVGNSHTCALTADGTAYCWGNNATGALGLGNLDFSPTPVPVSGGLHFSQISASYAFTCAVAIGGAAYCWGNNDAGQLGDGTTTTQFAPVPVSGGLSFTVVSARFAEQFTAEACGLVSGGAAYCWGSGFQSGVPVAVPGGHAFVDLSAGGSHSCGVETDGDAYCWGSYGNGDTTPDLVPGGLQWRSISVRAEHSCGITTENTAYCWGDNTEGQLGDGSTSGSGATPVPVSGGLTFQSVASAQGYTCGRTVQSVVYCWGQGSSGQLGQNTLDNHLTPVQVVGQP